METDTTETIDKKDAVIETFLDNSNPLLQKLRDEAPGTYKHSQALESMVENVSIALGLDVATMRLAALYHDIGKTVNPEFFSENQLDDSNPHDKLDPWVSAQIITRHVSDSVNILLNIPKFPRHIIEVISQHHGNSLLSVFNKRDGGERPEMFRYPCTKPQSIEAAVLIICDQIEAMSRSHAQAGKLNPSEVIEKTFTNLLDSGQLDEVTTRLGNLKIIRRAIGVELEGLYQKRVSYEETESIEE